MSKYYMRALSALLLAALLFGCGRTPVQEEFIVEPFPPAPIQYYKPVQPVPPPPLDDYDPLYKPVSPAAPLIVIDPGHGGKDLGTESAKEPKYQEKALNLFTARLVAQYLQKMGYRTVLTRKDDTFIELDKRAEMANQLKPVLFVSVHYNSAPTDKAEGIEVFFYKSDADKARTNSSKKLGEAVLAQVVQQTNAQSRGVKHGNLAVIRETNMPAVLVEGGFLTHPVERQKLLDSNYLKKIALGIAKGIDLFISKS